MESNLPMCLKMIVMTMKKFDSNFQNRDAAIVGVAAQAHGYG